jgi:hypothetical protein
MSSIPEDIDRRKVIVGVDTHKHIHVAVAIDQHGARLGDLSVSADTGGYTQLEQWAQALGRVDRFGIEGTGSYGAGLTSFLRRCGHRIVEVNLVIDDRVARTASPTPSTPKLPHDRCSPAPRPSSRRPAMVCRK